jgi:hypothetical protein
VRFSSLLVFIRRNITKLETIVVLAAIVGGVITLAIGGSVRSDTIRMADISASLSSPYGELNSSSVLGYADNYSGWTASPSTNVSRTQNSMTVSGVFQSVYTWTSIVLFKSLVVDTTAYPIFNINIDLTSGVQYGIRFFAQYPNGTEYDVWWEGSPLDHRPGIGRESLRVNMQRQVFLATGHSVEAINKIELYVGDPPNSQQSFQFTMYQLSFESDSLQQVSRNQYRAIYFDFRDTPLDNASWYLNRINLGTTIQASQGATFSIYLFRGLVIYGSTTATGLVYSSLTSFSQYTFSPTVQLEVFPELLPLSGGSIVFVATSGILRDITISSMNFVFLPTPINPGFSQESLGFYYVYFIFFLFLLPVGVAILVFREFLSRKSVPKASVASVLVTGIVCRVALAATTAHVFDMNVYLMSTRAWFQFGNPLGSLGPTLPLTYFLYWICYSPYALFQIAGFHDVQFLGHAAGMVEGVSVKLFPLLMDILTFFILLRFRKDGTAFVWATFNFLNPLTVFISSVWGQYEAATMVFIVWGIYLMTRQENASTALAFIISGMVELVGFFPYVVLLLRTGRMRLRKTLLFTSLAALPIVFYPPETDLILRLLLSLTGFGNGQFSGPGDFTLIGNFPQLSIISQFRPLLLGQAVVLCAASFDIYRQKMTAERLVFFITLSSVFVLLFSNLLASWVWLLPVCALYAIVKDKKDLGAFMLVFGTAVAFLEVSNLFGSAYLILGNVGYPILPAIEATRGRVQIFSAMVTALAVILLFFLKYGSNRASWTLLRTSGITLSLYLLLYFWLAVYPV